MATYFASKQYIAENRDVVDRFKRAMEKSLDYASSHADEVRAIVGDLHGDPAGGARQDEPAGVEGRPQRADDRADVEAAQKYGFIEEEPSLDDLILRTGSGR